MKKRIIYKWTMLLAILALTSVAFTACEQDEDGSVVLESFGPTPSLRGSTIRFIGSNLDQVTAVVFPENIEVKPKIISSREIMAEIPANAINGYVILKFPGGSITTKTIITYADAIEFESVQGTRNPVHAGDTITVKGDNLTAVTQVVFSVDVVVENKNFLSQSRYELTLVLPAEAQKGDVYLLAGAEESRHLPLDVDGPAITSITTTPLKAGRDNLVITGTGLDIAVAVVFEGGTKVEVKSPDGSTITVPVPADALNGQIAIESKTGLIYKSADALTLVVPDGLSTAPVSPSVGYKAKYNVLINGQDLDLVIGVQFADGIDAVFTYNAAMQAITTTIPETAIDGVITLLTVAGSATTEALTLVKPSGLSITPATIEVGDAITISGNDLDLVASVTFAEDKKVDVTPEDADKLTLSVPVDAVSGAVVLTLKNGVTVNAPVLTINKPQFCYIPNLPAGDVVIDAGTVFVFEARNTGQLTGVQVNGNPVQYIVEGEKLYVFIPNTAGGSTRLKLISANGSVEYTIAVKGSGTKETIVYQGPVELTWGDGGRAVVPASAFNGVGAGSKLKIYFTQKDAWGQVQINDGGWAQIPWTELDGTGTISTDTYNDKSVGVQEFVLTQDILSLLDAKKGIYGYYSQTEPAAIIIQGADWIINKISILTSAPSETVVWTADWTATWTGDDALRVYKEQLAGLAAGKKLVFYYTPTADNAQLKFQDANWSAIAVDHPDYNAAYGTLTLDAAATSFEWTMTADIVDKIMNTSDGWSDTGLILMGQNCRLSKISIK